MDLFDLIEIVFGLMFDGGLDWYRFYGCTIVALAVISLIYWKVPNQNVAFCVSAPIAVGGIGWGIAWEWRSRH